MTSDPSGARVGFEAVGNLEAPGTTIQSVPESGIRAMTSYNPAGGEVPSRMPRMPGPGTRDTASGPDSPVRPPSLSRESATIAADRTRRRAWSGELSSGDPQGREKSRRMMICPGGGP